MVRMPGNAHEVDDFKKFWSAIPGIDQVRVKEDETNLVQPRAIARSRRSRLSLPVARRVVFEARGRVYPCCQSYIAGRRADRQHRGTIAAGDFNSMKCGGCAGCMRGTRWGNRYVRALLHAIPHPLLVAGSLLLHGKWVRRACP